jgi:hypothetical protein
MRKIPSLAVVAVVVSAVVGCTFDVSLEPRTPTPRPDPPAGMPTVDLVTATPAVNPPATPTAWDAPPDGAGRCPAPNEGEKLYVDDEMGYCLLVPADYEVEGDGPTVYFHSPPFDDSAEPRRVNLWVTVSEAAGETLDEALADAAPGENIDRRETTVDGQRAVVLDNLPGIDPVRTAFVLREGRMITISVQPYTDQLPETQPEAARVWALAVESFRFLKAQ